MRKLQTVIIIALALFVLVPPTTAQQSEQTREVPASVHQPHGDHGGGAQRGRGARLPLPPQPKGARPPSAAAKPSSS